MRILMIGGTGVMSTPIARALIERGDDVTLFNRSMTKPRLPKTYTLITGNRYDHADFEKRVRDAGAFDCVIDHVCFKPPEAESLVRACTGRTRQVIFCSTVAVYSKPKALPIAEHEPRLATDDYGRNKAKCEDILMAAHKAGDFALTIIRPAYTYGEGSTGVYCNMGWNPPTYLDRFRKGKPIIVHGDGSGLCTACFSTDQASAFVAAIGNEKTYGNAYNVAGQEWMTYRQYTEGIAKAMGVPCPELVYIPSDMLAKLDPKSRYSGAMQGNSIFDTLAAARDLGYRQKVKWVDGLKKTLAWIEENDLIADSDLDRGYDELVEKWRSICSRI